MSAGSAAARAIDVKRYRRLLGKMLPLVIETEAEHRAALETINRLIAIGDEKRSREEDALLDLWATLVEAYERERHPIERNEPPREMLRFLMESNDLKAADLAAEIGTRARVSEILAGKRAISKTQAKKLGERFRVSPALFL